MADMMQGQEAAPEQGQESGDVGKLIQGVGMGLQKLAEVLPPEMSGKINELVNEFQSILQGGSEEGEEEAAPAASPRGGRVDMMGGANGRPMMQ